MKKKLQSLLLASTTLLLFSTTAASAFSSSPQNNNNNSRHAISPRPPSAARLTTLNRHHPSLDPLHQTSTSDTSNNDDLMRALGDSIILSAAQSHGATEQMISIEWKADRIIVTVDVSKDEEYEGGDGSVMVGELEDFEMDYEYDEEEYDDNDPEFDETEEEDFEALQAQLGLQEQDDSSSQQQIDLTLIARTINEYLSADGENTPQFKIAQLHAIEVTTPEFDNVLRVNGGENGAVNMFEVYKGFDVIVDYWEVPKKKKSNKKKKKSGKAGKEISAIDDGGMNQEPNEEEQEDEQESEPEPTRTQKLIEGKLVGRDDDKDVTMINVKGRIVKIKNDMIESVKLPKAKREKGVK
mmetsp:Transcript_12714/g.18224  ORF Transcript_12714/g.18224 Transcript_12714/m.18224 type:complete len:354 (-) Transcript_12714:78-1139(-)